jgi:hypothetical protein
MRILILTVQFYPAVNPNVYRWGAIAEYWAKQGHEVHILCSKRSGSPKEETIDNIIVHRAGHGTLLDFVANLLNVNPSRGTSASSSNSKAGKTRRLIEKIVDWTWRKVYWPDGSALWFLPGRKGALNLLKNKSFDSVISVGLPFTAHLIGLACKNHSPDLSWHMDIEDPFCYSEAFFVNNSALYEKLNFKTERNAFLKSDSISVTVEKAMTKYAGIFPESKDKMSVIPPLFHLDLKTPHEKIAGFEKDKIHLSYIGTFYENVRSPLSFLTILQHLSENEQGLIKEVCFHFFGEINQKTKAIFDNFPELNQFFKFHGLVNRSMVSAALQQSDFLINIGNTTDYHLPSKSVDYLMSGKPILNICQAQHDTFKILFKDYPLILNLQVWEEDEKKMGMELLNFIKTSKGKRLNTDELSSLGEAFQLPKIADSYLKLLTNKST